MVLTRDRQWRSWYRWWLWIVQGETYSQTVCLLARRRICSLHVHIGSLNHLLGVLARDHLGWEQARLGLRRSRRFNYTWQLFLVELKRIDRSLARLFFTHAFFGFFLRALQLRIQTWRDDFFLLLTLILLLQHRFGHYLERNVHVVLRSFLGALAALRLISSFGFRFG